MESTLMGNELKRTLNKDLKGLSIIVSYIDAIEDHFRL